MVDAAAPWLVAADWVRSIAEVLSIRLDVVVFSAVI